MKNNILFAGLAVLSLLAGCQKELTPQTEIAAEQQTTFGPTVFTLSASLPDAKAALDGLNVKWTPGDQIVVNGIVSKPLANIKEGGWAEFEFDQVVEGTDYCAVYPESAYVAESFATKAEVDSALVNVPAVQAFSNGGFDPAAAVLVGKGTADGVSFSHGLSYLKLSFDKDVKSVRVMSNHGMRVSGYMVADFAADSLRNYYPTSNYNTVTLSDGGNDIPAGTPVVIAIPAKNYSTGLNIFVLTSDGKYQILKTSAFKAEAGKLLVKEASLSSLKDYQGPGIYSAWDWASFVCDDEASFTTDPVQKRDRSAWVGEDGEVNIYEDFAIEGNLLRHGSNLAALPGVDGSSNPVYFRGVLDGNGHTLTQTASTVPLISIVSDPKGTPAEIKNLTLAGECTSISNSGWGTASFAIRLFRGGKMTNCINKINTTIVETEPSETDVYVSGMVTSCGGWLTDCVNEGNMDIQLYSSANRKLTAAGIAGSNRWPSSGDMKCGDFTRCINKGNIKVVKHADDGKLACFLNCGAMGGICAQISAGTKGDKQVGNYSYFDNCSNTGNLTFWDDNSGTASGNQLPYAVGGIIGVSSCYGSNCLKVSGTDGYYFIVQGGANTGTLDLSTADQQAAANNMSGARQAYVGGLVGFAMGTVNFNDQNKQNDEYYPIVRGSNNSIIKVGSKFGSEYAGGIIGGCAYVKFEYIHDSKTVYQLSDNPAFATKKVGGVAGLAGWVIKRSIIYGRNATIKMDASPLGGSTAVYGQGVLGITGAVSPSAGSTDNKPYFIFENNKVDGVLQVVNFAGKKADGSGFEPGPVASSTTRDCYYGGYAKSGPTNRTKGNLTVVEWSD